MYRFVFFLFCLLVGLTACANQLDKPVTQAQVDTLPPGPTEAEVIPEEYKQETVEKNDKPSKSGESGPPSGKRTTEEDVQDGFTDIAQLAPDIRQDIRYATTNNFTKKKIYDCPRCLLRTEVAKALVKVHRTLKAKGYGLKVFDCYRPRPYQSRLWDAVPNPNYVTPPAKGSMHSRGAAVDLTVVDASGKELDMGTPYDFFGPEAHTDYLKHPAAVLANRRLLREAMEAAGFAGIRTEWWHFSFRGEKYALSDYVWKCE